MAHDSFDSLLRTDGHPVLVPTPEAMSDLGAALARTLSAPRVIALCGDLGAGKTTMAKGMISALANVCPGDVTSPTFQYVQLYHHGDVMIAHFDLWRLRGLEEFLELGLEEYLSRSLAIVEWPDRIREVLPTTTIWVEMSCANRGRCVAIRSEMPTMR